jgi:hypothetical protein
VRATTLSILWFLSVLPMVLDRFAGGGFVPEGASRLGLALLPWIALAGLPRGGRSDGAAPWFAVAALALPPLALAAGLDVLRGAARGDVLVAWGGGVLLVALLAAGADGVPSGARARSLHALLWLLLIPISATLLAALAWAAGPGSAAPAVGLVELGRWNPLVWVHSWSGPGDLVAPIADARPLLAVALLALVPRIRSGAGRRARRREGGES